MKPLKVAYLKLDLAHNVIDYNDDLKALFNVEKPTPEILQLGDFIQDLPTNLPKLISEIEVEQTKSIILIRNNQDPKGSEKALFFLYAVVSKTKDEYLIRIVNWLNWVHNLYGSFSKSYSLVSNLDAIVKKDNFSQISDASCFKAMYPLLTHVPDKFVYGINQGILFEIMHFFVRHRNEKSFTKDYSRNIYSRIRTNLKQDFNIDNTEIIEILHDDKLLNIKHEDNIHIPKTAVNTSVANFIENDTFLINVINAVLPI